MLPKNAALDIKLVRNQKKKISPKRVATLLHSKSMQILRMPRYHIELASNKQKITVAKPSSTAVLPDQPSPSLSQH